MVRTDCRTQKLDAFLQPKEKPPPDPAQAGPSLREAAAAPAQPDSVEMDESDDGDMLEALAQHEAEMPEQEEVNVASASDAPRLAPSLS